MPAWEGHNPNISSSQQDERKILKRDPTTGEVIYQRDEKGQEILDRKGRKVPEMVTLQPYALNEAQEKRVADNKRITDEIMRGNLREVDTLIDRISTGHSVKKHVQGQSTLGLDGRVSRDAKSDLIGDDKGTYGPRLEIKNPQDLKNHLRSTVNDPDTVGYTKKDGTIILFNQKTNILLVLKAGEPDGGTAYRADDGVNNFIRCLNKDEKDGKLNGSAAEALRRGGLQGVVTPATPDHGRSTSSSTAMERLNQLGVVTHIQDGQTSKQLKHPLMPHHVRALGLVGGALAIASGAVQAAEAEGRSVTAKDVVRSAWEQTAADPLSKGRYAEAVMRVLERADPTPGVISSGLRGIFGAVGADVDPGLTAALRTMPAGALSELKKNAERVGYLQRDQFFLLQSAGLIDLRDENGQRRNMDKILRDPETRSAFLQNLNRAYEYEQNPEQKEKLKQMIGACHSYVDVERERQATLLRTTQILDNAAQAPTRTAQSATPAATTLEVRT